MKKSVLLLALIFLPISAFAVPSVRMLGAGAGAVPSSSSSPSGTKITPARAATVNNANTPARLGTLKTKTSGAGTSTGAVTGSSSRFPVITAAKVYNNVNVPTNPTGGTNASPSSGSGDINVENIVNEVTNRVQNNYYDKNQIDNRFEEVNNNITNINNNLDDSRFDAIRTTNPRVARGTEAPEGYVYIWIEE